MPEDTNRKMYCSYHREHGHYTTGCVLYKQHLEELASAGHLNVYIDSTKTALPRPYVNPERTVGTIITVLPEARIAEIELEMKNVASRHICASVQSAKRKLSPFGDDCAITFTPDDLQGVELPHNDALIVTITVGTSDVRRVLIDAGSSAEVMFHSTFKALELDPNQLRPSLTPLVGFSGAPVHPLGLISLPVRTGSRTVEVEFVVVSSPSPYNVILGRAWLHELRGVASSLHQMVKYPGWNGRQEVLRGDQMQSKRCQISSITNRPSLVNVHNIEAPLADQATIDDVGVQPEDRSVEELVRMPINEDGSRYFLLGGTLAESERTALFEFPSGKH